MAVAWGGPTVSVVLVTVSAPQAAHGRCRCLTRLLFSRLASTCEAATTAGPLTATPASSSASRSTASPASGRTTIYAVSNKSNAPASVPHRSDWLPP